MVDIVTTIFALLLGITVHECSHATVATILGDDTAKKLGRLSLNPLVHLDPVGTIMMLVTALTGFGIGWGKPVPVNPMALRPGPKNGMAMVACAGPLSNFILAGLLVLPVRMGLVGHYQTFMVLNERVYVQNIVVSLVLINVVLGVFNLIPLSPLDGSSIILGFLPMNAAMAVSRLQAWGPGLLMAILLSDQVFHVGIFSRILSPSVDFVVRLLFGG